MTTPSTTPSTKQSHLARNIAIVVLVVVIIIAAAYLLSGPAGLGSPQNVAVSGYVGTGFGTHPTNVEFTAGSGSAYYGTVSITNNDQEGYSAQLPNGQQYSVTVFWNGALGTSGNCNAGTFTVNQGAGSGSLIEDFTC